MSNILTRIDSNESIPDIYPILNGNMDILENFLETFDIMFDSSNGNIDLSLYTTSKITAKEINIPLGNQGISVGTSKVEDTKITTKQIIYTSDVKSVDSIQHIPLTNNMINGDGGYIVPSPDVSTITLNPSQNLLQVELNQSVGGIRQTINVRNLSTNNSTVTLLNNNFMIHTNFTSIELPFGSNITLQYVNDFNVNVEGWMIVGSYGVTFN